MAVSTIISSGASTDLAKEGPQTIQAATRSETGAGQTGKGPSSQTATPGQAAKPGNGQAAATTVGATTLSISAWRA
jgi:hypothetical protein